VSPRTFLVVNADDLGYSSGVNRGIFEAHDRGIVTSTSLMVHRSAAEAAVAETWSRPELGVGVHFDLGSWADDANRMRDPGVLLDGRDAAEIAADAHGQLNRFRELVGRDPTHLDSHHHVHTREPVASILSQLAWDLGLPLRHTSEAHYCGDFYGQSHGGEPVAGSLRPERLATLLRHLPDGPAELCCHPGYAYGLDSSYAVERELELRALCDPRLKQVLAEEDIALVSFAELRERRAA
jgi:chitin disaccharide deacetylase